MKLKAILEWQEAVEVHMNAAKMGWPKHDFFGRWWWMLYHEAKRLLD